MTCVQRHFQLLGALCALAMLGTAGCQSTVDADGDGFTEDVDCDDSNSAIHPDSTEICDGRDNNCDEVIDEAGAFGSGFYYTDSDGDGFGTGDPVMQCTPPTGTVPLEGDCDDEDDTVYPEAPELCNGADEDCNGEADFGGVLGSESDDDEDGFTECAGDCDDDVAHNFPGNEEVCDGDDNDCNGLADFITGEGDEDGDLWSACLDCDDNNAAINPGATEACDGVDNDCNGMSDADPGGEADVDGDGYLSCNDCHDDNPAAWPGNPEICDGIDNDCSGAADFVGDNGPVGENDGDGDGSLACEDCNDSQAANFPGNPEICDGLDNDCSVGADYPDETVNSDGDAAPLCADCDDDDPANFLGNPEICDGQDNDCNDLDDFGNSGVGGQEVNVDGDPALSCDDCDDADPLNYPGNPEVCDGQDNDCNSFDDFGNPGSGGQEVDGDGDLSLFCADCDDSDPLNYPTNTEVCDGQDNDCNGFDDFGDPGVGSQELDDDGDNSPSCVDCDDSDATNFPGNSELCDGLDNDCIGGPDFPGGEADNDGDGSPACLDCDDFDVDNFPGNPETCDGQDNDCIGGPDFDGQGEVDSDGDSVRTCDNDCDDSNAQINPNVPEACDGVDTDCNGIADADSAGEIDGDSDGSLSCEDCNDNDNQNAPGALEQCDGQDNDCNNLADFGGAVAHEQDGDGDNVLACADCDDSDINNYPGNAEVCDGQDNDCDNQAGTPPPMGTDDFGDPGVGGQELDFDGDLVRSCNGDCDDNDPSAYPGNIESCPDNVDNDCSGVINWGFSEGFKSLRLSPGTSDHLSIPAFGPNSPTFTIEAWVKADAFAGSSNVVVSKAHQSGGVDVLLEATSAGNWEGTLNLNGEETVPASSPLNPSAWTHLALSFDGTQTTIYVNGTAETSQPNSNALSFTPNNGQWLIGAVEDSSGQPSGFWDGLIDEVRIWEVARTAGEIEAARCHPLTGSEFNLIAYYPLDTNFEDASPNARHATASPSAQLE